MYDPKRAALCFGDLGDFYTVYTNGIIYTYFPQYDPAQYTTPFTPNTIPHMAFLRMLCMWSLYEVYGVHVDPIAQIPYMLGVVLDTHIAIVEQPASIEFHAIYKQQLLPEQYKLIQHNTSAAFVWCEEMTALSRVYSTTEILWREEITIAFGTLRCTPNTNRTKHVYSLARDTTILRKGLPRPTSIRYIESQIKRGLEGCDLTPNKIAPSKQPCLIMALFCSLLGAYKHSTQIAPPLQRVFIYRITAVTELLALTVDHLTSVQLYNILAEFNIAWANQHLSLCHLLRRMPYWKIHQQTVLWQCANITRPFKLSPAFVSTPPKPTMRRPSMAAMRRALLQTTEEYNTKNLMYYLYKSLAIRKRVPKAITSAIVAQGKKVSAMYRHAIASIRFYGVDTHVLEDMGMQPNTLYKIQQLMACDIPKRVSKLVSSILSQLTTPCDRAILYLYLHALRERYQFEVRPLYQPRSTQSQAPLVLCLSCLTVRTKSKGERATKIRNSGIAVDLDLYTVYCCACHGTNLVTIDASRYMIQTPSCQFEHTPIRILMCTRCHVATCRDVAVRHGTNVYCPACAIRVRKVVYDTRLLCGCIPRVGHKKNKMTYHNIVAYNEQTRSSHMYTVCSKHFAHLPTPLTTVTALKQHFTTIPVVD